MEISPDQAAFLRDLYVVQLGKEHETFMNVVNAAPDGKLGFKPEDRVMTFGSLALHVAGTGQFFSKCIRDGKAEVTEPPPEPPVPSTTAEVAKVAEGLLSEAVAAYRGFTPEQLAAQVDAFGMGAHAAVFFINWDIVHLIHHRAQMALYLRIAGEKVPSIYGPTLDVSFEDMMGGQ